MAFREARDAHRLASLSLAALFLRSFDLPAASDREEGTRLLDTAMALGYILKVQGKRPANHVLDALSTLQGSPGPRSSGGLPCPKLLRSRRKLHARQVRAPLRDSSGSNA
jgi:hypothetical protein